ncbi:DUF3575 domain-containing protein [Flavobacterium sp. GA093]|uniref:DUF3575 domain-containing protein n=1 Tax=Flavobacterium hydrocarbonoxydans TaxID=2683249 RepID=A0A6I4NPC2_9FLAO|nr:DUF3575 domain-containing protein [Flavobacterium hydrocarbonoxydans]MWB96306.1 DUF3575 domain-containing protein [Flavobacterium hydrocarbonoxydans]
MKKKYLIIAMLFSIFVVKAQDDHAENEKKNELKLNVLVPLSGAFEGTYERNLNKKSSVGVSVFTVFNNDKSHDDLNYSVSPYYRRYFGKKFASGFFAEGFGMLSSIDGKKIYDINDNSVFTEGSDVIDFSLGLGLGSKWVTKSGFIFEINAGLGKLLFNADKTDHTQVARFGFHVGYRF